jgi:hypothetical protein
MKRLLTLFAVVSMAAPALAQEERVTELERKVDVLTQELEQLRLGGAADTTVYTTRFGFAPAASKVYGIRQGVSIGGYGEMLLERFDGEREDGVPSSTRHRLDYLRQIVYLGYKFNDEVLFNSEIELEHAGVRDEAEVSGQADPTGEVEGTAELSGEVVLEFAYLDWARRREFGLRAGMLLVPVGLVNELHEPPIVIGTRRPDVESRILPTTWRANGLGVFGELPGGVSYRAYLLEGLNGEGFTASNAIRGGRQNGSRSLATKPGTVARLDYSGTPGLLVGASLYNGAAWQGAQPAGAAVTSRVTLFDLHGRWQWQGLELRGLYARGSISDVSNLSDALGLVGGDRLGRRFLGFSVEAAYDVLPRLRPGSAYGLLLYVRYERTDTQAGPGSPIDAWGNQPTNDRTTVTAGLGLKPHPNVMVKLDRQRRTTEAETGLSQWNAAIGYLF